MASENKKRKAKNSYIYNGGDKCDKKIKHVMYFTKRQRNKNKDIPEEKDTPIRNKIKQTEEEPYVATECICDDTGVHYLCPHCGRQYDDDLEALFCPLCDKP